jgi:hypothetical protein
MTFLTSKSRNRVVSINEPHAGLDAAAVQMAADLFLEANPFDEDTGDLVEFINAQRVSVTNRNVIAPIVA